jgi:hypothetical protein
MRKLPEIPMQFDYADLRGPMVHVAVKFCKRFREFQIDELINEFWLSRPVRTMTDIRMVWQACEWAFWHYYRKQHGYGTDGKPLAKRQGQGSTISLEGIGVEDIDYQPEYYEPGYDDVDAEDFREAVWERLNERERAICDGRRRSKTLEEIGREFGVSRERVRQIETKIEHKYVRPMLVA